MSSFYYFIFLIIAAAVHISFSFQRKSIETQISQQALDNLYIFPVLTTHDIITIDECSVNIIINCLTKSFFNAECLSSIFKDRLLNKSDATTQNEELFLKHLKTCSIKESKNINLKYTALSKLSNYFGGIPDNINSISVYPKCMTNISACFIDSKCAAPSHYNVFDKIINACSDEAFKQFNITFHRSKRPVTTYIDDLESLGKNKIGPILDSYTTNFPRDIIDAFGNLTYEEFDALKLIAATVPYLKQYFCDSQEDPRVARKFEFIQRHIELTEFPQLPEKTKNLFKTFTTETYQIVKYMLSAHPHLRWSFCSPIFAISPSKELTNIFSPPITLWALQNCREMAELKLIKKPKKWNFFWGAVDLLFDVRCKSFNSD